MRISSLNYLAVGLFAMAVSAHANAPSILVPHPAPSNILPAGSPVSLTVKLVAFYPGIGTVERKVVNYFDEVVYQDNVNVQNTGTGLTNIYTSPTLTLPASLPPGFYKLTTVVNYTRTAGGTDTPTLTTYFGVAPFSTRTAADVIAGGYRFGLKTFSITEDNSGPLPIWNLADAVTASMNLGFQWTRHLFNQTNTGNLVGSMSFNQLVTYPVNVVSKVEGFPESCFDTTRYGDLATWKANHSTSTKYDRSTVPERTSYQAWLSGQLDTLPTNQPVYELGNEPNKQIITGGEFAEYCQMILTTLNAKRSAPIVGPNLGDEISFDRDFIAAGGMAGMSMVTLHPYSFTPLPEVRTRVYLRNVHDFYKTRLGHDVDFYTTEYGWSNAPASTTSGVVDEKIQAQRTARQDLMLYAEGLKTLIPHWMGDIEKDPTNWDQWFGFFHRQNEPRPVVLAHANCARMIDGSTFVGDLDLGPGIGAMLFNRGGVYTLALWTAETNIAATVNTGVSSVDVIDIMGKTVTTATTGGNLSLNLSGNVIYLNGVSASLASSAIPPTADLNPDTWSTRVGSFTMQKTATPPTIDGNLADWAGVTAQPLTNSSSALLGNAYLRWDDNYVYVAAQMTDAMLVASSSSTTLTSGDAFRVQIGARPSRQMGLTEWSIFDYAISMAPTSTGGGPAFRMECVGWDAPIINPAANDPSGIRWACVPTSGGWAAEARIPISLLAGFPAAVDGAKVSCFLQGYDKDTGGTSTYSYFTPSASKEWPYLVLQDSGIIVDNADTTRVTIVGAWTANTNVAGYYGTNYVQDGATGKTLGKTVRFTPNLPAAGYYQVFARWTSASNRANNVPLTVYTATGPQAFLIDETINGGQWELVGTFSFNAGTGGSVLIANAGTLQGKMVTADAVKFLKVTGP